MPLQVKYSDLIKPSSPFFPLLTENSYKKIINIKAEKEVCGVIKNGEFFELINYSRQHEKALIDMDDISDGDILFHTHASENSSPVFSKRDILTGKRNKIPLLLYHPVFKKFDFWSPYIPHPYPLKLKNLNIIKEDYLNLPYQWIRSDCYSFCRDVAKGIYNLDLPDIYNRNQSIATVKYFFRNPEKLGFKRTTIFKEGCFVLMQLSADIPYHMGIITKVFDQHNALVMHQLGETTASTTINIRGIVDNIVNIYAHMNNDIYFPPSFNF